MKSNMGARCTVLFSIYISALIISSSGKKKLDAIENLKLNLVDYYLAKCYLHDSNVESPQISNLHPDYLNAVNAAKALILEGKINDGRIKLINATVAMIIDEPDLIESQFLLENIYTEDNPLLNEIVLRKVERVVESFVQDVSMEKSPRQRICAASSSDKYKTDAIENLKLNLVDYHFIKCYLQEDLELFLAYNLHPNYLNVVRAAKELLLEGNIDEGRTKLINATKAMITGNPDLVEIHPLPENYFEGNALLDENVLRKVENIVDSFVKDVAKEKKSNI